MIPDLWRAASQWPTGGSRTDPWVVGQEWSRGGGSMGSEGRRAASVFTAV